MKLIPKHNILICEKLDDEIQKEDVIIYNKDSLPMYKIIRMGVMSDDFRFKENDIIVANIKPNSVNLDDRRYYLIRSENVVGKVN